MSAPRIGVTLPVFRDNAEEAIGAARRAEELGLDGVFVFDHLWPAGQPGRPALSAAPMLGALVASTDSITVGSLVARIGLVPDAVLVATLASLQLMSGGRFVAGLGTGDRLSEAENRAYGIPYGSAAERRESLRWCLRRLRDEGVVAWVGGGSAPTVELAFSEGVAVNLWGAPLEQVAALSGRGEVTWAGPVEGGVTEISAALGEVLAAGATWAVCAWPRSLDDVAAAARRLRER